MKERKLNYRFHNPNPAAVAADYILRELIEANVAKVEAAVQNAAKEQFTDPQQIERSA